MKGYKKNRYDVVIIGAGIHGCCLAFELAKRGVKDILLLEREYISSGATGRCGAGIRTQFGSPLNLEIAIDSMAVWYDIEKYTGYDHDCQVQATGYMCLALNEAELRTFEKNVALQATYNTGSTMLSPAQVKALLPAIDMEAVPVLGASWNAKDGYADPHHCTFAFAKGAQRLGVEIATYTPVRHILAKNGRVCGVETDYGVVETDCVYNITNSFAPVLAAEIGDLLPIKNERHQILITEPVGPMGINNTLMPMVLTFSRGTYSSQKPNGSFTIGIDETPPHSYDMSLTADFLPRTASLHCQLFPIFRKLRVLRLWAGFYDISPDENTIIHYSQNAKGLCSVCGLSGHGFLLAPRTAQLIANKHCGIPDRIDIHRFGLERYETGELLSEPMCV